VTIQPDEHTTPPRDSAWLAGYRQAVDDMHAKIEATTPDQGYRNAVDIEFGQAHRGEVTRVRWLEDRALDLAVEVGRRTKAATNLAVTAARNLKTHNQAIVDLAAANAEIARLTTVLAAKETKP